MIGDAEEQSPILDYSDEVGDEPYRRRRLIFAKSALWVLASTILLGTLLWGAWWWVYGGVRTISPDLAKSQLQTMLGPLESQLRIESAACQRNLSHEHPNYYYYHATINPSAAKPFLDSVVSAWLARSPHELKRMDPQVLFGGGPHWWPATPNGEVTCYYLGRGCGGYCIGVDIEQGRVWIEQYSWGNCDPIVGGAAQK